MVADPAAVLRGAPAPDAGAELLRPYEDLRPSELCYLPPNLTRPEIARELYVSINTVNTHIRNIYSKVGVPDRSSTAERTGTAPPLNRAPLGIPFAHTIT